MTEEVDGGLAGSKRSIRFPKQAPQPALSPSAGGAEDPGDVTIIASAIRCIQRRPAVVVARVRVRTGSEQCLDIVSVAMERRMMQRRPASAVLDVRVRAL